MNQLLERIESWCHILEEFQSLMNTRQRIVLTAALQTSICFRTCFPLLHLLTYQITWQNDEKPPPPKRISALHRWVFLRRSPQGGQDGRACSWSQSSHSASEKWGRAGVLLGHLTNLCLIWKAFCCTNQEATVTLCATMTLAFFSSPWKIFQTNTFRA